MGRGIVKAVAGTRIKLSAQKALVAYEGSCLFDKFRAVPATAPKTKNTIQLLVGVFEVEMSCIHLPLTCS
jgi:hypothetical protein